MFTKQFFGKTFWYTIAAIAAVHVLAIPVQHQNALSLAALALVVLVTAWASWRSLPVGLAIALGEIMVGGHGHLLEASVDGWSVSLRMAVFAAVMGVWLVRAVRRDVTLRFVAFRDVPFALLAVAVIIATIVGFTSNAPLNAFDDMNSYLTLAYLLPLVSIDWTGERKRLLLQVLSASVVWIAVSTLLLLFLFTHLPGKALHEVYAFARDARLAEVTLLTSPEWFVGHLLSQANPWYFRIFEPAHFFALVGFFVVLAARFLLFKDGAMPTSARFLLVASAATLVASMSRSFMIGLAAGLAALAVLFVVDGVRPLLRTSRHVLQSAFLALLGAAAFWAVIVIPVPPHPDLRDAAFYRETADDDRELAVSSRWNLLYPMFTAIMEHPVLGSGFGKEVTFVSDDPRVREITPSGEWTTYRFEWGYQDIWLKMGVLGLIGFIAYGICTTQAFFFTFRTQGNRWLALGLFAGLVALFATHAFSPYLNHPIGLGYMLFVLPFFDWSGLQTAIAAREAERARRNVPARRAVPILERK